MIDYIIIFVLLAFSALLSGLTLRLMSLNAQGLKRKAALGDKNAAKVWELRQYGLCAY
jgi:CBS domain containing-hemolysin-like protein